MPDHDYQTSEFRVYKTTVAGLSLGFIDPTAGGYVPKLGETLKYDGSTVILKDGRKFPNITQLRGAITEGWLVAEDATGGSPRPRTAGIQVRGTEQRGRDSVPRRTVVTMADEERYVGNVEDRRVNRERTNEMATRRVPLESAEARHAFDASNSPPQKKDTSPVTRGVLSNTTQEDADFADLLSVLDAEVAAWVASQVKSEGFSREEADIISLLNSLSDDDGTPEPAPIRRYATPAPTPEPPVRPSARALPVERDEDVRLPLVREEPKERVLGTVARHSTVEREQEIPLTLVPATPQRSPAPASRFGGVGVVIVDEQDMGAVVLSSPRVVRSLDESAKSVQSGASVRVGEVEVGRHKTASVVQLDESQGVPVGRILSPLPSKTLVGSSTSTAVEKPLRVERVERAVVATGDVQEAIEGDDLEDLLPDAFVAPPVEPPAYAAVRMMIPDFAWNSNRPQKDRVAEALRHVNNPLFLKGILTVETPLAREEIQKGLKALQTPQIVAETPKPD